jgi:hypothetical protein
MTVRFREPEAQVEPRVGLGEGDELDSVPAVECALSLRGAQHGEERRDSRAARRPDLFRRGVGPDARRGTAERSVDGDAVPRRGA